MTPNPELKSVVLVNQPVGKGRGYHVGPGTAYIQSVPMSEYCAAILDF